MNIKIRADIAIQNVDSFDSFDIVSIPDSCSCHLPGATINSGSGSITITGPQTVSPNEGFSVNLTVNGFTEASSKKISLGLDKDDGDNGLFLVNTQAEVNYDVDVNGGSLPAEISGLVAPITPGRYDLTAMGVEVDGSNMNQFWYILGTKIIIVEGTAVQDSTNPTISAVQFGDNNNTILSGLTTVLVNASDETLLSTVLIEIGSEISTEMNPVGSTGQYSFTIKTMDLKNGVKTLNITAIDSSNNIFSRIFSVEINNEEGFIGDDWNSYRISTSFVTIGDGQIAGDWKDIPKYTVKEYEGHDGEEGWIKSVHDPFYLYVLIAYPTDLSWISFELNATDDPTTSMADNNDGWAFGVGTSAPLGEENPISWQGDIYFVGNDFHPKVDTRNDLIFENITNEGITYIEFIRPLNTNDPDGADLVFEEDFIYQIKFASNRDHKRGGTPYTFTITSASASGSTDTTTITTETTTIRTPEDIKAQNEFDLVILTGLGFLLNITLIIVLLFYTRRS